MGHGQYFVYSSSKSSTFQECMIVSQVSSSISHNERCFEGFGIRLRRGRRSLSVPPGLPDVGSLACEPLGDGWDMDISRCQPWCWNIDLQNWAMFGDKWRHTYTFWPTYFKSYLVTSCLNCMPRDLSGLVKSLFLI